MAFPAPSRDYPWMVTEEELVATEEADESIRAQMLAHALPLLEGERRAEGSGSGALLAFLVGFSPALLLLRR